MICVQFPRLLRLLSLLLAASIGTAPVANAQTEQAPPPAAQITPDPWPKLREIAGVKYTLYQPQVDKWDGYNFEAHAAVGVVPAGSKDQIFGAVEMTAVTDVAKVSRTVHFRDVKIVKAVFPTAPDKSAAYRQALQTMASSGPSTMSLDRLEISLAINGEEKKARAVPVKNDPPRIVFSQSAAILVPIDGAPVWRLQPGTKVERAINTRAFVALDDSTGRFYVHIFDGFVEAPAITGPWTAARSVPPAVTALEARLAQQNVIDPMTGPSDPKTKQKASLKNGVPEVIVTTTPTELIVTEGAPDWVPIEGTMLLYVKNTTGNVFKNLNDQQNYVLVTGRWFHAPELSGPWRYIAGTELPPDFTRIPDDSPKENVKAAVPYTTQADEALIANGVPQTATVDRAKAKFTPQIDGGSPDMRPIPDTGLSYVFNSPTPIIMVSADAWYAVQNGVWFSATWALGPWVVATSVPAVIYSIPASSPLHYVTYVQIYNATPQVVVVGYTPGYLGTVVAPGGVVVYGTGYTYTAYVGATRLVSAAGHVRLRGESVLDAVDGLGDGLRHGHGARRRDRPLELLLGLLPGPLLGRALLVRIVRHCLLGARRGRRLGLQRLGRDLRQRVPPVGRDGRRHAHLGRLQRLDRQRVEHAGGPLLQLHDRPDLGRRAWLGAERVHGQLRLWRPRRDLQPEHRRRCARRHRHGRQRLYGHAEHREVGTGVGSARAVDQRRQL